MNEYHSYFFGPIPNQKSNPKNKNHESNMGLLREGGGEKKSGQGQQAHCSSNGRTRLCVMHGKNNDGGTEVMNNEAPTGVDTIPLSAGTHRSNPSEMTPLAGDDVWRRHGSHSKVQRKTYTRKGSGVSAEGRQRQRQQQQQKWTLNNVA